MVVMAPLSRPERPDLVFVSPRRGRGVARVGVPALDASGFRGLAAWGVWVVSCPPEGRACGPVCPGAKFWCRSPGGLSEELLSRLRARRPGPPVEMGARGERGRSHS